MENVKQLGVAPLSRLLLNFTVPAIISLIINGTFNVVDRIFIGHSIGSAGIAAITAGLPLMTLVMAFTIMVAVGASALISIRLGERNRNQAELIMGNALVLIVLIMLLFTIVGLLFLDPLLYIFGAGSQLLEYARDYMRAILYGLVFIGIGFGMNHIIRAEGNPAIALAVLCRGAVLNVVFCPLFIVGFGWGISGAAWATVLAQAASAIWSLSHFLFGKNSIIKLRPRNLMLQSRIVKEIFSIGVSAFSVEFATAILTIILNNTLVQYGGTMALAAIGIVNSVSLFFIIPVFGISHGIQPIVGYNYGGRNFKRVKKTLKAAVIAATAAVMVGFIAMQNFAEHIIGIFGTNSPELINFGAHAMRTFTMLLPVVGFQIICGGYFQAVGKPGQAMLLILARQILLLILIGLVLPPFFGLNGVLYAGPIADFGAALITVVVLYHELRRLGNKHI